VDVGSFGPGDQPGRHYRRQGAWESADCQLMDNNCSKTGPVFHSWEEHPPFLLLLDVRQKTAEEDSAGPGRAIQIAELADC
jgi:hypothetical protein